MLFRFLLICFGTLLLTACASSFYNQNETDYAQFDFESSEFSVEDEPNDDEDHADDSITWIN